MNASTSKRASGHDTQLIIYWDNDYDTDVWNIEMTQQAFQLWMQLKRKVQTDIADVGHRESTSLWKGLVKNWLSEAMADLSIKCHVYFQFSYIKRLRCIKRWKFGRDMSQFIHTKSDFVWNRKWIINVFFIS